MNELKRIGEEVAAVQDAALETGELSAGARDEFLARVPGTWSGSTRRSRRARITVVSTIAAVTAAAAAVALVLLLGGGATDATVGTDADPLVIGATIAAPANGTVPIRFSDGSSVLLSPAARARVVSTTQHGAHVELEQGTALVDVTHRRDTSWRFDAGPYQVAVIGTRFDVAWNPTEQSFTLDLDEGKVRVNGPLLADGRVVAAGQQIKTWVEDGRLEVITGGGGETAATSPAGAAPMLPEQPASSTGTPGADPAPVETPTSGKGDTAQPVASLPADRGAGAVPAEGSEKSHATWQELSRQGRYREAIARVDAVGFENVVSSASASDLMLLGDTARLVRSWDRADTCYRTVRERFPGSQKATTAAYAIGRMAFDQQHLYKKAARWLDLYLQEAGGGTLAREASGRLFEAWHRAGDTNAAARAARQYLASYPDGPSAALARQIIGVKSDLEAAP